MKYFVVMEEYLDQHMIIKGSQIKTISPFEALELSNKNECNLIDIRDAVELQKLVRIENSFHISSILFFDELVVFN